MRAGPSSGLSSRALLAAVAVVAQLGAGTSARADGSPTPTDKAACIAASEDAQQLKIDGKLTLARTRLLACARAECPAIVKQDCGQWLAEVDAALPTVVLGARDAAGRDLFAVRVLADGVLLTDHLDGRPLALDPGPHVFRFEAPAVEPVELRVLARAGERNRAITATFAPPAGRAAAAPGERVPAPEPSATGPSAPSTSSPSALAWVFGALGVAGLGAGLYFEVAQASDYNHLSSTCAGHCPPDQVDHVGTERWVAGVSAGVGLVALGVAGYFLLSRPSPHRAPTRPAVALDAAPLSHGGGATLTVRF